MIDLNRLQKELVSSVPIRDIAICKSDVTRDGWAVPVTFHSRAADNRVIRIDWPSPPTAQQIAQADAIVMAHDGAPNAAEKLDALRHPARLVAALTEAVWARSQNPPVAPPAWARALVQEAHERIVAAGG